MARGRWAPWGRTKGLSPGPRSPRRPGPRIRSQRGEIGATWWGRKWIAALSRFGWETRLERGRSYARRGLVLDLRIRSGEATARVQGSRPTPYRVRIAVRPISDRGWRSVERSLATRSGVAASLLAGDMPIAAEEMFRVARLPLFPESDSDFQSDCNCPDWANPCKHVAAVHYVIGETLDRDPFLLFLLRGRSRESLLGDLRRLRSRELTPRTGPTDAVATTFASGHPRTLPSRPSEFWKSALPTSDLMIRIGPPRLPRAPLRRLGEPPFLRGDPEAVQRLESLYDSISARALALALGEGNGPPSNASGHHAPERSNPASLRPPSASSSGDAAPAGASDSGRLARTGSGPVGCRPVPVGSPDPRRTVATEGQRPTVCRSPTPSELLPDRG